MDLARDLHTMIRLSEPFAGGLPSEVTLPSGQIVRAVLSVASSDDAMVHENVVTGSTRKLSFVTSQVSALRTQQNVFWNGQYWGILTSDLEANGSLTTCFIGSAF